MKKKRAWVFATVALGCSIWGGACAGSAKPAGVNEACFRALDCQTGLVCVEGVCTNDITPIVPEGAGSAADTAPGQPTLDAGAP